MVATFLFAHKEDGHEVYATEGTALHAIVTGSVQAKDFECVCEVDEETCKPLKKGKAAKAVEPVTKVEPVVTEPTDTGESATE